jgi:hypothetical protein
MPPKSNLAPSAGKIPIRATDFILSKEFAANTLAEFTGRACGGRPGTGPPPAGIAQRSRASLRGQG